MDQETKTKVIQKAKLFFGAEIEDGRVRPELMHLFRKMLELSPEHREAVIAATGLIPEEG